MKKTKKEIQQDMRDFENIVFETFRLHEEDKTLEAFNDEFEYFQFANMERESDKYSYDTWEERKENEYLASIDNDDIVIRRYFIHSFISFLTVFFRLFQCYFMNEKYEFTETGKFVQKMYNDYLNLEIE